MGSNMASERPSGRASPRRGERFVRVTLALAALALVPLACATLAKSGGGDANPPNAAAGPFREIRLEELGNKRSAPYALKSNADFERDVAVIDADGDPATLLAYAYAARVAFQVGVDPDPTAPTDQIVRHVALDGRSFDRDPLLVLAPDNPWEGGVVGAPSALATDGQVLLYYAAAEGIGLAESVDGASFARLPEPVLRAPTSGWDTGLVPRSPSVLRLPDGRIRLLYEVELPAGGSVLGEAESQDGTAFVRVGRAPLLEPRHEPVDDLPAYDGASVEAPSGILWQSQEGRLVYGVYYAAMAADGRRSIALAARFGVDGALERAAAPVFGGNGELLPDEPCVIRFADFTLLFATELAGTSATQRYPAVAAGVAPATASLPPPDPP